MADFSVTILGSNSALPAYNRFPSAQFIQHKNTSFLVDCGEGTQFQLNRYHIKRGNLEYIFISHMHGDHYYGLVGLLNSFLLNNRQKPLYIFGPPELEKILLLQTHYDNERWTYPIHFHPIKNTETSYLLVETADLVIYTIPLQHKIPCTGFLFKEKPKVLSFDSAAIRKYGIHHTQIPAIKAGEDFVQEDGTIIKNELITTGRPPSYSYAYCSDTRYDESIIELIREVTVLYHEATFLQHDEQKAFDRFHSTTKQAAQIAKLANVHQLVVGHYSARYKDLSDFLSETQAVFKQTRLAIEGEKILIGD